MIKFVMQTAMTALMIGQATAQPNEGLPGRADLATLNCKSIFQMDRTSTVIVLAWLQRHFQPRDAAPVIEMEKLGADGLKLSKHCDANPGKTVMEAAGELFGLRL